MPSSESRCQCRCTLLASSSFMRVYNKRLRNCLPGHIFPSKAAKVEPQKNERTKHTNCVKDSILLLLQLQNIRETQQQVADPFPLLSLTCYHRHRRSCRHNPASSSSFILFLDSTRIHATISAHLIFVFFSKIGVVILFSFQINN